MPLDIHKKWENLGMTKNYRSDVFGFIRADELIKQEEEKQKRKHLSEDDLACDCCRCKERKKERGSKFNKILNDGKNNNVYREDKG